MSIALPAWVALEIYAQQAGHKSAFILGGRPSAIRLDQKGPVQIELVPEEIVETMPAQAEAAQRVAVPLLDAGSEERSADLADESVGPGADPLHIEGVDVIPF